MNALSRILARFTFLRCLVLALALPATAAVATTFPNSRSTYSITKTSTGFSVTDNVGTGGTAVLTGSTQIIFADMTVNLLIGDLSRTIAASDLKTLIELYIAFFNRIPEADGLAYWINQYKGGMTMDQITNSFYVAAIQYSSLTGYSSSMSDVDFVAIIYKNVLGRTGPTAPTETEVHYWADQITSGALSRYGVTARMLNAAHAYAGDPVWGWVPQLLDNKFSVATIFCLEQGLNYNTPEESIAKGMAIAAAVTPTSTAAAIALIGVTDVGFNLTAPPVESVALPNNGPMTSDSAGNIFIAASGAAIVVKVDNSGTATLFAGQTGVYGVADGSGSAAQFTNPSYLTTDVQGNVYVSDGSYYKPGTMIDPVLRAAVRKITPSGVVTTFAGSTTAGNASDTGTVDAVGTNARFVLPAGLAFDPAGNLFVADLGASNIREITPTGLVTTFVGTAGVHGIVDGVGGAAQFFALGQMVSDAAGNLYVTDSGAIQGTVNIAIRKITPGGAVTTLAAQLPFGFGAPSLAINPTTRTMYYTGGDGLYKVTPAGVVSLTTIPIAARADLTFLVPNILAILSAGVLRKVQVEP